VIPSERRTTHVLSAIVIGMLGFLLFAPFGVTASCVDGINGGGCRNQDWSTVTGLTFSGDPNPSLGISVGALFAIPTWFLVGRIQRRSH
jgi:hypothetical protein